MSRVRIALLTAFSVAGIFVGFLLQHSMHVSASDYQNRDRAVDFHALAMIDRGRNTFRYDTFGDQDFWGGTLQIHKAIEGQKLGGVGPGVDPETALAVGLKVDQDALPESSSVSEGRKCQSQGSSGYRRITEAERSRGPYWILRPFRQPKIRGHPVRYLPFHRRQFVGSRNRSSSGRLGKP